MSKNRTIALTKSICVIINISKKIFNNGELLEIKLDFYVLEEEMTNIKQNIRNGNKNTDYWLYSNRFFGTNFKIKNKFKISYLLYWSILF